MIPIRIVAIPTETVEAVRETQVSPFAAHPTHTELARGHGPCRHCLRAFEIGQEQRLLFTYDPFASLQAPALPGPVFVHSRPCQRYPEDGELPEEVEARAMTLYAYSNPRKLHSQEFCEPGNLQKSIETLLSRVDAVDYIHVHDTEAGCYDFRVERRAAC